MSAGRASLVEEARRRVPELERRRPDDALRRLGDDTWRRLLEGGFLRALQPARWGGGEVPLLEFIDARGDLACAPSAGWVAGVIGVHPWQLALFSEEAQQEMWGDDPTTMHSSSYNPTGKAEKAPGGYRCGALVVFFGMRPLPRREPGRDRRRARVRRRRWRTFVRSYFCRTVPYRRQLARGRAQGHRQQGHCRGRRVRAGASDAIALDYALNLQLPGRELNDGPLYRLPWSVVFNMALAASVFGSVRGFVDAWIETAHAGCRGLRRGRYADTATRRAGVGSGCGDHTYACRRAASSRDGAGARECTMAQRAQMRWNMNRGCQLVSRDAIGDLFRAASGRSIFDDHPLQRRFQDVLGALGHAYLVPDPLARVCRRRAARHHHPGVQPVIDGAAPGLCDEIAAETD